MIGYKEWNETYAWNCVKTKISENDAINGKHSKEEQFLTNGTYWQSIGPN